MACDLSNSLQVLHLLHLVSPALPVGAYSYSEGLEAYVDQGIIAHADHLREWLAFELTQGAIRLEANVLLKVYPSAIAEDSIELRSQHQWLSAFRETEEMRLQSLQMGRSLLRLLADTETISRELAAAFPEGCHFAIAFALAASHWGIDAEVAVLGYLQSWLANLANAGVRLIPLGQTAGQQILLDLYPTLIESHQEILSAQDELLWSCNWGSSLASMSHETQYSRLFRS